MQNEHLISHTDISDEFIREYLTANPELDEITCLVPQNNEAIEEDLKANGFRYMGKRTVEGEVSDIYRWLKNLELYEDMGAFFDRRADDYDLHMCDGSNFYETGFISLLKDIPVTEETLTILDLGCGTGAELKYVFDKVPNAHIVCVDVSEKMLNILREKYSEYAENLDIMCKSYLTMEFGNEKFDYVITCSTLHHLLAEDKLELHRKIKRALKPEGVLLILDYISLTEEEELTRREKYLSLIENGDIDKSQIYHIDIPLTPEHEEEILKAAGFELVRSERVGENYANIVAKLQGGRAI
jgi:tRNA (cmo5U34)-methyltransferase